MSNVAAIQLDIKQAEAYASFLQTAPEIAEQEMAVSLNEALLLLEREVKERTPVGVGGGGGLRGSITSELRGRQTANLHGRVFSPLAHALPVELGTKPHWAPIDPIQDWVEVKLGIPKSESRSVAFMVARKIARKGTEGAHMFENAFSDNTTQVLRLLNAGIDRLFARLGGGG